MKRAFVDQDVTPTDHLTGQLPDSWEVTVGLDPSEELLFETIDDANLLFVTSRIPVTRAVIEHAPQLEVIAKLGTGIDNVDLEAAAERGVPVTHTPGHNALAVAEHTIGLVLATARRLTEARALLEAGKWRDEYTLGTRLSGSTVGVVGFGNVGKRVGTLLSGFDVDILLHDPYVPRIDAELVGGRMTSLERLLEDSDVVVVSAELTEETRGSFGAEEFSRMKGSAILVNTARGPIVDESALLDALRSGEIAGAGLDVFATEPLGADSPLLELDNVVLTPHVSAITTQTRKEGIDRLVGNVLSILDGRDVPDGDLATPG